MLGSMIYFGIEYRLHSFNHKTTIILLYSTSVVNILSVPVQFGNGYVIKPTRKRYISRQTGSTQKRLVQDFGFNDAIVSVFLCQVGRLYITSMSYLVYVPSNGHNPL